ncbi:TetR family transcriptional regulator [Pseudogracilibacillus auburnensis]|uniref:TetR family transcriptional regulator n=1 Tax=Pseudogracilibacillus auburnensis TaxID=1494959 RepID=UPI003556B7D0
MQKIVDHDHKRKMIVETAWKIIETEGIEKASTRRIASEVGMSTRALRHYFSNKMNYYYLLWNIFLLMRKNGRRILHGDIFRAIFVKEQN